MPRENITPLEISKNQVYKGIVGKDITVSSVWL